MPQENPDYRILQKLMVVGQERGAEKKLAIIRAVIESLATRGIQGTTYDSVGRIAKMQRSHVAYYFGTLEELITMAIRYVIASAQEVTIECVQKAHTPTDRVSAIVTGAFEQAKRNPKHATVLILFWYLSTLDPHYRFLHTEVRQTGLERLEHLLEWALADRKVEKSELTFIAKSVQAIIFGYLLEALATNLSPTLQQSQEKANEAVLRFLQTYR